MVLRYPSGRQEGTITGMSGVNSIRQMRRDGESVSPIARATGVSRDTVYKYLRKDDLSPEPLVAVAARPSKLDPYKPLVDLWIEEDAANWRKQRHISDSRFHISQFCFVSDSRRAQYEPARKMGTHSPPDAFVTIITCNYDAMTQVTQTCDTSQRHVQPRNKGLPRLGSSVLRHLGHLVLELQYGQLLP